MKRIIGLLIMGVLFLTSCLSLAASPRPEDEVKKTIEDFYSKQYEAYLKMEYRDIESFLDMTKIQNQNKVIALKRLVARRKYINEKAYGYVEKSRFKLTFNYKTVEINNDIANVDLDLIIEENKAYPPFISWGHNSFKLEKNNNKWKIVSHSYEGINIFEGFTDKKLPELNLDELKKQVDAEFGKQR